MVRRVNIVLGESDSIIAEDISALVRDWGFNLLGRAATQAQLLSCVRDVRPDIVMLDHMLKGGYEFSKLLDEIRDLYETSLIVFGQWSDGKDIKDSSKKLSMLDKPFRNEELRQTVEKLAPVRAVLA